MSTRAPDPIELIIGPPVEPSPYRCPDCYAVHEYPEKLPTGGVACVDCGGAIRPVNVLAYATFSRRLFAVFLDIVALVPTTAMLLAIIAFPAIGYAPKKPNGELTDEAVKWITVAFVSIISVILVSYFWYGNASGTSAGKQLAGIRVVRMDTGGRPGIILGLARMMAQLTTLATLGGGYAIGLLDGHSRTLHDRIAGTVVVEK